MLARLGREGIEGGRIDHETTGEFEQARLQIELSERPALFVFGALLLKPAGEVTRAFHGRLQPDFVDQEQVL